jgi:integrase
MAHPIQGDELRALRELHRQYPDSGYAFATERGGPFTSDAVNRLIKRIGSAPDSPSRCTPTCSATPAAARWRMRGMNTRALQDWLGHRSIQHTVRYTELSPTRFRDFWRD